MSEIIYSSVEQEIKNKETARENYRKATDDLRRFLNKQNAEICRLQSEQESIIHALKKKVSKITGKEDRGIEDAIKRLEASVLQAHAIIKDLYKKADNLTKEIEDLRRVQSTVENEPSKRRRLLA